MQEKGRDNEVTMELIDFCFKHYFQDFPYAVKVSLMQTSTKIFFLSLSLCVCIMEGGEDLCILIVSLYRVHAFLKSLIYGFTGHQHCNHSLRDERKKGTIQ